MKTPSLKSYPSSCFLLFCLLAAVWTLCAPISPGIPSWHCPAWFVPCQARCVALCETSLAQGLPGCSSCSDPACAGHISWVAAEWCIRDRQLDPTFLLGIFEGGDVLISAICRICSVGWAVYLGDVNCLYFSPTICATESPEKLLLASKSGHCSDTEVWKQGPTWLQGCSGCSLKLRLAAPGPAAGPQELCSFWQHQLFIFDRFLFPCWSFFPLLSDCSVWIPPGVCLATLDWCFCSRWYK